MQNTTLILWILGVVLTIAIPVGGYIFNQQDKADEKLEQRVTELNSKIDKAAATNAQASYVLRSDVQNLVLGETAQRMQADRDGEERTARQIERLLDAINAQHTETKNELRELRIDIRTALQTDRTG